MKPIDRELSCLGDDAPRRRRARIAHTDAASVLGCWLSLRSIGERERERERESESESEREGGREGERESE